MKFDGKSVKNKKLSTKAFLQKANNTLSFTTDLIPTFTVYIVIISEIGIFFSVVWELIVIARSKLRTL